MKRQAGFRKPTLLAACALALGLFGARGALAEDLEITKADISVTPNKDAQGSSTSIHIRGKAKLPDGTMLWLRVIYRPYKIPFMRHRVLVHDGTFSATMGPYEQPLFPDRYDIGVSFYPDRQPRAVQDQMAGRSALKSQLTYAHQLDKAAAARIETVKLTAKMVNTLDSLSRGMCKRIVTLRTREKNKKLPRGEELKAWVKWGNLWDLKYDGIRKENDERRDSYYLLPFVRTEKALVRVINYLMDFQYEYKNLLDKEDGFRMTRNVKTMAMLVFQARGWFRYEKILLSARPGPEIRNEIIQLAKKYIDAAREPLPTAEQVDAALAKVGRSATDSRRLALYQLLLARHDRAQELTQFFATPESRKNWIRVTNRWLLDLRNADWTIQQEAPLTLAGVPGLSPLVARLQLADLRLLARMGQSGNYFAVLPDGTIPAMPTDAALTEELLQRYGLAKIHRQAIRHQMIHLADLIKSLAERTRAEVKTKAFDEHEWDQWSQVFDSKLLQVSIFELDPLGSLSTLKKTLETFAKRLMELRLMTTRVMMLKVELERSLSKGTQSPAIAITLKKLSALEQEARNFSGRLK